jgi:hypothetical protein
MQWLRLYDDVLDDPKVQRLPPELFKHWINILCLANKGTPRGSLPSTLDDFAFRLRLSPGDALCVLTELQERGLIVGLGEAGWKPHNWDERQFKSDDVNARVKAHRDRNVTRNVTPQKQETLHVTPPDTEQKQIQTQNRVSKPSVSHPPERGAYTQEFETFWKPYPPTNGSKADAFKAWKQLKPEDRAAATAALPAWVACEQWRAGYVKHAGSWLRGRLWEVPPAATRTRPSNDKPEQRRPSVPRFEDIAHRYTKGGS